MTNLEEGAEPLRKNMSSVQWLEQFAKHRPIAWEKVGGSGSGGVGGGGLANAIERISLLEAELERAQERITELEEQAPKPASSRLP